MKPKPFLTLLLAVVLGGGLLAAFPHLWMGLLLLLLGVLAAIMAVLRRSLTVVQAQWTGPNLRLSRAHAQAGGMGPDPDARPVATDRALLNEQVFQRFRAHLESAEQQSPDAAGTPAPAPAAPRAAPEDSVTLGRGLAGRASGSPVPAGTRSVDGAPAAGALAPGSLSTPLAAYAEAAGVTQPARPADAPRRPALDPPVPEPPAVGEVRDHVALSSALRQQGQRLKPPPRYPPDPRPRAAVPRPPAPEPEEPDLFADLRPNAAGVLPPQPARASPAPPASVTPAPPAEAPAAPAAPPPAPAAPPASPRPAAAEQPDQSTTLLRQTEDALARPDVRAARASLEQYLARHREAPHRVPWRARQAETRLDILEGNTVAALDAFEAMLKSGYELREEQAPALVEGLVQGAPELLRDSLRVSLLLKVLAVFRQANQREAMDRLYPHLAAAQEQVGDDRKLVQLLKNHLEIKRVLGEVSGQADLIDQIGNRLFKLGETEQAKEYYTLGLKLRGEQQDALASAGGGPAKSVS